MPKEIIQFVNEILTPNNNENTQEFYQNIIDALVNRVYVFDDKTIVCLILTAEIILKI